MSHDLDLLWHFHRDCRKWNKQGSKNTTWQCVPRAEVEEQDSVNQPPADADWWIRKTRERKERTHLIHVNPPSRGNCTWVGHSANSRVGEWHTDTWEVWGKVCYWPFCSPKPMLKPWPPCDGLRLQDFGGVGRIGLSWWDLCPQRRESRTLSFSLVAPSPACHERTQPEDGCLQVRKRALTRNQPCWHPDLKLLDSRTGRGKNIYIYMPIFKVIKFMTLFYDSPSRPRQCPSCRGCISQARCQRKPRDSD